MPEINQKTSLKVIETVINYLKIVIAMLEELKEGKDVERA